MLDGDMLRRAREQRDRLLDLQHDVEQARSDYHYAVRRLHATGGSLREIADELGLSHQRVHQIVDAVVSEEVTPETCETFLQRLVRRRRKGSSAGPFHRFTDRARDVIVHAQQEAAAFGHNYIGTEHILLGLLRVEEGLAAKTLASLGVERDAVRREIERLIGRGGGAPAGQLPFTPRSKKVLELALRESLALKHNYIGTEHILLGLVREGEGVAAKILDDLGADSASIRSAVLGRLAA